MKKIFVIDWLLVFVFILSAASGIGLHIAGHCCTHEVWHNWAVSHVVASLLFLIAVILHISTHWQWFRGIVKHGAGKKSRVTVVLSVVFLLVAVTGIILLGVSGANSRTGLLHYKLGIVAIVLCTGHILKRIKRFPL